MAELQVTEFLSLLKQCGLLTAVQWETAQDAAKQLHSNRTANPGTAIAASLAKELVTLGLLTPWQANQLLKGQTGFVLEKYRLLGPVGKGGMGHVFQARDETSGAIVAVKVMARKLTVNQTLVNRFRREIRASSLLKSPNIVRTLDAGRVGKVDFMVMEFVNGDQLDHISSRISSIPVSIACDMIRQAAIGLQHAHAQKMVHRDIKPGNLIINWSPDGKGTVKIMDMGLVRLNDEGEEETSVTRAGQVMGTPDYMSPEQGWDTATVDARSDLYSLGCTFFRLITGRVPFPGDNPLQVLMARCSKDAPSARTHRPEIPEVVDGIVRRMTLRDPNARFQTAAEVISALMPFCSELTQEALRKAMQDAGLDDKGLVLNDAGSCDLDSQDIGFQQFLKEMEAGAAVDLMLTTNGDQFQALSTTLPVSPPVERRPVKSRAIGARQRRPAAIIAIAAVGAIMALTALNLFLNRNSELDTPSNSRGSKVVPDLGVLVPVAKLKQADSVTVRGGQVVTYQPEFDGAAPNSTVGSLQFRFGPGAPAAAKIDPATGVVEWSILEIQSPAEYFLPIEYVFTHNNSTDIVAQTTYSVIVEGGMNRYTLPRTPPLRFLCRQAIEVPMTAAPPLVKGTSLTYRLGEDQRPGMSVHPETGQFKWLPSDDDAGRHSVTVELCDSGTDKVLATGSITLIVLPMSLTFSLPAFAEQKVRAGEAFELKLSDRPMPFIGRVLQLQIMEGAPEGIQIDSQSSTLRWQVPNDAKGRYEIRLKVEPLLPELEFAPGSKTDTTIVVNVESSAPVTLIPTDAEITAADIELRELFKREIAQAKSSSDRAELARQLLDRAEGQMAGAADFALLNLAAEFAELGKSTDVALDINQRRAERYQTNELAMASQLLSQFRASSATSDQQDAITEHCLRLGALAAAAGHFTDVGLMLQPTSGLLKKADRSSFMRQMADDVQQVIELADGLAKDVGTAADVKIQELQRILNRWQFTGLFTATDSFSYLQSGDQANGLPDSGRSLWNLENNHVRFEAKPTKGVLGIIETVREPGRYIIRMQVSAQTTSAMLILGASRDQNLDAHIITLDASAFGQIATLPVRKLLVAGNTVKSPPTVEWNDVEISVDGQKVSIKQNGQSVSTSQLKDLRAGRLGVLVSLERITPPPKLDIRRARILLLPDAP